MNSSTSMSKNKERTKERKYEAITLVVVSVYSPCARGFFFCACAWAFASVTLSDHRGNRVFIMLPVQLVHSNPKPATAAWSTSPPPSFLLELCLIKHFRLGRDDTKDPHTDKLVHAHTRYVFSRARKRAAKSTLALRVGRWVQLQLGKKTAPFTLLLDEDETTAWRGLRTDYFYIFIICWYS